MDIVLSRQVKKFIAILSFKHARQITVKLAELKSDNYPDDSKILKGTKDKYYGVSVGEFRIIYKCLDTINIFVVDRRNDDSVYKTFFNQLIEVVDK